MSDKKKFSDTGFAKFIKEKVKPIAGDVLEVVGDITGRESITRLGEVLNERANIETEEGLKMKALLAQFEEKKMEWELEMNRLELEAFKMEVQDRESARSREVEFMRASGGKRDWVQGGIVILTFVLLIATMTFLAFMEIPQKNERIFDMLIGGVVVFGTGAIYNYYFGSSKGSKSKDEIIKNSLK